MAEHDMDYDSPWKEVLERYFQEFMEFFFPAGYRDINWAAGYEFLDKELQQIVRDAELGRLFPARYSRTTAVSRLGYGAAGGIGRTLQRSRYSV